MSRTHAFIVGMVCLPIATAQPRSPRFTPGHVFITEIAPEACYALVPINRIREIDVGGGASWVFADDADGLCGPNGVAFTPDGKRLRVLNLNDDTVEDLDASGRGTVVYDWFDGIYAPWGQNGLAFDRAGDFFVSREGNAAILQFVADRAPGAIFGRARGGIAFAGEKLYVAHGLNWVYMFSPSGARSVFDTYANATHAIASDRAGDLFVGTCGISGEDGIYRYDRADVTTRRLLTRVEFLAPPSCNYAMTLSPDETELYVVDMFYIWGIDVNTGAERILYELPDRHEPIPLSSGYGIAVYWPPALPGFVAGDVNCDGTVNQFDITPFIAALTSREGYDQNYPNCLFWRADVNEDGTVNPFDIQPFIELLGP